MELLDFGGKKWEFEEFLGGMTKASWIDGILCWILRIWMDFGGENGYLSSSLVKRLELIGSMEFCVGSNGMVGFLGKNRNLRNFLVEQLEPVGAMEFHIGSSIFGWVLGEKMEI